MIRKLAMKMLEMRGIECWVTNNVRAVKGRTFVGRKGIPDVNGFVKATGIYVGMEVKTVNDKLSNDQHLFLTALSMAGGIALLAIETEVGNVELVQYMDYIKQ